MRAVVVDKPGKLAIREINKPKIGPYEALVQIDLAAICNSTDTKLLEGHFPGFDTYPTVLGHECVGRVVETGEKVTSYKKGDRVLNACAMRSWIDGLYSSWGSMAEFTIATDAAAMSADGIRDTAHGYDSAFEMQTVLPTDITPDQAILLSTWREVYSAFEDFGFKQGKSLVIFGGGPVGLSFVKIARTFGMGPIALLTRSQWKLDKAKKLGADWTVKSDENAVSGIKEVLPDGADFVVDAVGSGWIMNDSLKLIKFGGAVCVYGTVPESDLTLVKESAPYNWKLIVHQWPDSVKEAAAQQPLCEWIRQGKISSKEFITHQLDFSEVEKGFELIRNNEALKVLLWLNR